MKASVNGATQIRAGVMRPEIIIPSREAKKSQDEKETKLILDIGKSVRVIREPFFGKIGVIKKLPVELTKLPTESMARVLEVEFENGERAVIPRANVEVIATNE
jgi:transcription antitermination factor NusG